MKNLRRFLPNQSKVGSTHFQKGFQTHLRAIVGSVISAQFRTIQAQLRAIRE